MEHSTEIHLTITLARVVRTLGQGMQQCLRNKLHEQLCDNKLLNRDLETWQSLTGSAEYQNGRIPPNPPVAKMADYPKMLQSAIHYKATTLTVGKK